MDCEQPATAPIPTAPKADEWIEWTPPITVAAQDIARLSERASTWIADVLGIATQERQYRTAEHDCLHGLKKAGQIR